MSAVLFWLIRAADDRLVDIVACVSDEHTHFAHLHAQVEQVNLKQKLREWPSLPQKLNHLCPSNHLQFSQLYLQPALL